MTSRFKALEVLLRSVCICLVRFAHGDSSVTDLLLKHSGCEGKESIHEELDCAFRHLYGRHRAGFDEEDKSRELTYGEITVLGVQQFIDAVPQGLTSDDVFFDLGSGVGKSVFQVYLTTDASRASGVELAESRHLHGVRALSALRSISPEATSEAESQLVLDGRELSLMHGDVLTADISRGTVFFVSSLAFPDFVLRGVAERFSSQMPPGTVAAFSDKIPGCHRGLAFLRRLYIAMTWSESSPMFLYIVTPPESAADLLVAQGSAAIDPGQWGMHAMQTARVQAALDAQPEYVALHRFRGEEESDVLCIASDVEARAKEGPDELEKLLQSVNISAVDANGLSLFRHVCEMHISSYMSTARYGKEKSSFSKYQEKKRKGLEGTLQVLLQHRADPSSKCSAGRTALQAADESGNEALAALLRSSGAPDTNKNDEL